MSIKEISGFMVLFKPRGESSRQTLNRLLNVVQKTWQIDFDELVNATKQDIEKRNQPRVGHAGTLDPLAEGVLVAGIGNGTKLIEAVQMVSKHYIATFQLGVTSDTEDIEGEIVPISNPVRPTWEQLHAAAQNYVGRILQRPPAFSAIKVAGKRAYQLARHGFNVRIAPREINVYRIEIISYDYPFFKIAIECGSGTYVRSLGRDIAETLGSGAIMTALIRNWIGPFHLKNAVTPEQFGHITPDFWEKWLLPLEFGVTHLPYIIVSEEEKQRLLNGQMISMRYIQIKQNINTRSKNIDVPLFAAFDDQQRLVSLVNFNENQHFFKVKKNFLH